MENKIHHIGLQITENDLNAFYITVLGCKIIRTFEVSSQDALSIFGIPKSVKIVYTQMGNIELELFTDDTPKPVIFNHTCILTNQANEIANKAMASGYRVYVRKKSDNTQTYFVSDSNNNIFEIKAF
ncbi:MAG: VOC family protein [Bacteroidales bacterium]